jgi:hypothetical protein
MGSGSAQGGAITLDARRDSTRRESSQLKPTGRKFNMKERKEEVANAVRTGNWKGIPPLLTSEPVVRKPQPSG